VDTTLNDGPNVACLIESNGTQLGYYQEIKDDRRLQGRLIEPDKPQGTKEMRASVWGSRIEDGIIYCVRGEWTQSFLDECDVFPNGDHDDQVDGVSGAMNYLSEHGVPAAAASAEGVTPHAAKPKSSWNR
jgi:predicted phage terminase large subunit-like protein